MSQFRELAQALMNPQLDSHFGETVYVKGMATRPNFPASPDPARPPVAAVAIFTWKAAYTGAPPPRDQGERRIPWHADRAAPPEISTRIPQFSFAAPCAPTMKRGDQILRRSGELFEVTSVAPDGVSRLIVSCVQLGVPNARDQ